MVEDGYCASISKGDVSSSSNPELAGTALGGVARRSAESTGEAESALVDSPAAAAAVPARSRAGSGSNGGGVSLEEPPHARSKIAKPRTSLRTRATICGYHGSVRDYQG